MTDHHALGADEHLLDEQAKHALALGDRGGVGLAAQARQEALQGLGELEVGFLVDEFGLQGVELGAQGLLLGAQRRHALAQLGQRQQLLLVGLDQPADGGRGAGLLALEPGLGGGGGVGRLQLAQPAVELGADERGVGEQRGDVVPAGEQVQLGLLCGPGGYADLGAGAAGGDGSRLRQVGIIAAPPPMILSWLSRRGEIVVDPCWARVGGPLEPYAEGLRGELERLGYTPLSAAGQVRLIAHLSRWMAGEGLSVSALTPATVDAYFLERRAAGYVNSVTSRSVRPLLEYLQRLGAAPPGPPVVPATPAERLLARYRDYLLVERGLAASTAALNVRMVRPFLADRARADGQLDLEHLRAGEVSAFVVAQSRQRPRSVKRMVTAVRSLLGFLHVDGVIDQSLAAAVPSVAAWSLSGLPKALNAEQVTALLSSCDPNTPTGCRDLAILTLLVRLGLRAGEVAALGLADIDWRAGELTVRGKGNRHDRLPLPADVGQAIVDYLQHARPDTAGDRTVFVRAQAPYQALTSNGVTTVVVIAGRRAGIGPVGAHRLRHTAATAMLAAGGSLTEIGQVLRHQRPLTTAIYAKVDQQALRPLARPWPGDAA